MTPATILLTATFQVISNCMNNGSITQHVIANRFLHTNSKEASGSIDAKASLSLSEFYDLYKDSDIHHSAKTPLCLFLDHLRRILAIQFKPEGNAVLTVVNAVWLSSSSINVSRIPSKTITPLLLNTQPCMIKWPKRDQCGTCPPR